MDMKRKRQVYILTALVVILAVALAVTGALLIANIGNGGAAPVFAGGGGDGNEALDAAYESQKKEIYGYKAELAALESELDSIKKQKTELEKALEGNGAGYADLSKKIADLEALAAEKDEAIRELKDNIAKLEGMYLIDINTQLDILTKLSDALANPVMRDTGQTSRDSDGGESAETGKPDGIAPHISIYYEDIEKGYTYSYNPDEVMNPASMIKAPFVLSLFMEASKEERAIKEAESSGSAVPERVYDMTKKIVYTREQYYQPGSGEIQKSEDGTEYTYKDLFYYLLRYSDNVAYKILKDAFGTKFYSNLVVSLGATSMYKAPVGMSARDAAKCMRAVYNFIENDEYYGKFMRDALVGSAHQVLIANSVYPAAAAHKYGWDVGAYDDMAIVYDEHPYILVIMTDYDEGGKEVNEYLQNILGLIVQMHKNFYKER